MAVATERAPGGVELRDPVIVTLGEPHEAPPLDLFRPMLKAQLPTILDHASLTLRHPRRRAIFRLVAASMAGCRATLGAKAFVEIQTPKIVAGATESGANVFAIDYFGRSAYLAQSPQVYKQIMAGAFERVFEVGPVFRTEPHDTPRHLNEYVSLDAEMGFIEDHTFVMAVLGGVVHGMPPHGGVVHGMPPHGGFAIGLERWVAQLIGAPNLRETAPFPRDLTRLTP